MFVRRSKFEQLVSDAAVSQERERLLQLAVEQVEYLRLLLGQSTTTASRAIATPDPAGHTVTAFEEQLWLGEEEEDLLAMRQAGVISDEEFEKARIAARQREHIIE